MTVPLPDISAIAPEGTVYRDIIANKFSYAFWDDYDLWTAWVLAVGDTATYATSAVAQAAAGRYSSFAISVKCSTA